MADINLKLKSELKSLISKLEIALTKFKERKLKDKVRGKRMGYGAYIMNDEINIKEKEIKSAHIRSIQVKKEIEKIKRKLESAYDVQSITEIENDIKDKEATLSKIEDNNQQMKKVGDN